ncbi:MAG: DNA polymerase III subunit delta [Endomicrobium sp.]|jgi:DNA polymerase-3 subunit delta|nr:DNA polymerase III subunit delta [Endomicrobium sp.]
MPILRVQDFDELIFSKRIFPIYLFAGEESYLIDKCLDKTGNLFVSSNFNKEVFYASESSFEDILSALQTIPFLSDKKIVIVKGVNKMKAIDAERFSNYLMNNNTDVTTNTSCLVFLYNDNYKKETVLKRKEFINKCISLKNCICVDCRRRYESEIKEFIINEFSQKGKTISYDIVLRIIEENGTDLFNITNEIEKISLFVGERKNVMQNDLEKISGYTKDANVYALSSSIESKDLKKSMFVLEKLLREGEGLTVILSVIASTVRKMLNAKSMIEEQNLSISKTALTLKIHNFYVKTFFENLQKHNTNILKESLKKILKVDIAIKTGENDAISTLEEAVLFICNRS